MPTPIQDKLPEEKLEIGLSSRFKKPSLVGEKFHIVASENQIHELIEETENNRKNVFEKHEDWAQISYFRF